MVEAQYAKALFELSLSRINVVIENFDILIEAIKQNKEFVFVMSAPNISKGKKKIAIEAITAKFDETFTNFLCVLIDNNRFYLIKKIYKQFKKLIMLSNNILEVEVHSASKLSSKQHEEIKQKLMGRFTGKNIVIKNIEEPSLIGGIQIICEGESLDISLKNKLEQLKAYL